MKVLHVINNLQPTGPVKVLADLIRSVNYELVEPVVVCLHQRTQFPNDAITASSDKIRIHYLGYSFWSLEFRPNSVAKVIEAIARDEGADIIHTHGYHPDLLHPYLSANCSKLSTQHNIASEDFVMGKGAVLGRYMCLRLWQSLRDADAVVAISSAVENYCAQKGSGSVPVYTIPNGIDWERFAQPKDATGSIRAKLSIAPESPLIVSVGRLSKGKDPLLIIRAFKRLLSQGKLPKGSALVFLGIGPLLEQCQKEARDYQKQIFFEGFCPDVTPYLEDANLFISASHSEGFGLNLAEALASKLPVVATRIPAFDDMLAPIAGQEALRFEVGDLQGLCQAILQSLTFSIDEVTYQRLHHILDRARMGNHYYELYQSLRSR